MRAYMTPTEVAKLVIRCIADEPILWIVFLAISLICPILISFAAGFTQPIITGLCIGGFIGAYTCLFRLVFQGIEAYNQTWFLYRVVGFTGEQYLQHARVCKKHSIRLAGHRLALSEIHSSL